MVIIEKIVRLIKHSMRHLNKLFIEFMPEILEMMANNYTANPLPPYLYLMEISMTVFPGDNEDN